MVALSIAAVSSLIVVLRFDGSLRPPQDLHGFARSPVVWARGATKPLDGNAKLASCSATISLRAPDDPTGEEEEVMAVGASGVPNVPGLTSADAEYDGLLFGLEWLVRTFSAEHDDGSGAFAWNEWDGTRTDERWALEPPRIIVRGDCKAVIDQLSSRSAPRKTETKYKLAMERIQALKDAYATHQRKQSREHSKGGPLTFGFEHVPREENTFCDALCQLVINIKQAEIVESTHALIQSGEESAPEVSGNAATGRRTKSAKRAREVFTKNDDFRQASHSVHHHPQLCHSSRLALACELTKAALRRGDAAVLRDMSGFFAQASRRWSRICYAETTRTSGAKGTLSRLSVACEALSQQFSGPGLAAACHAENMHVCEQGLAAVFDFCTHGGSHDSGENADAADDAILRPYQDISATLSNVEAEAWRRWLRNWNTAALEDRTNNPSACEHGVWIEGSGTISLAGETR